jgi:hypothetical protein
MLAAAIKESTTDTILQSVLSVRCGVLRTNGDASFDHRRYNRAGMLLQGRAMSRTGQLSKADLGPVNRKPYAKQPCCIPLAAHRPKVSLMKLLQVRRLWALWRRETAEDLQSTLSGILACVVDVLPVIPEASVDGLRANGNGA